MILDIGNFSRIYGVLETIGTWKVEN